ncbi:MAG: hypothetical protein KC503_20665 [Myxococcales bacterium]|nr:hypothetical protein [Myxococcales bacterium]
MFRKTVTLLAALSMSLLFVACGGEEPIDSQTAAATRDRVADHASDRVGDRGDQVRDRASDRRVTDKRDSDRRPNDHRDVRLHDRHRSDVRDHRRHDFNDDHRLRDVHSARDFLERLRRANDHQRD